MPVTSIVELQFRDETLDEAMATLSRALEQTRQRPGCSGIDVFRAEDDPARVVMIERWESSDDDRAYREWRATPEGSSGIGGFVAGPPRMIVLVPVEA